MRQSKLFRVCSCLSLLALAGLTLPACATKSNDEAAKGKDAKAQESEPAAEGEAKEGGEGEAIAGKPVEGEQKVATAEGEGGANEQYALQIDPGEGKVGEEGKVSIKVVPKETWHMNLDYPTKLEVAAPAGVEVAKAKQGKDDAVSLTEESAEFAVAFTPSEAGEKTFTGEFKFAVCQDTACVPKTEKLEFKVAVK